MKNLTIGIFGNSEFIKELGKKGTVNDLSIYHHVDSEHIFTFVSCNSDKIQSLLQAVQMTEVPLLIINNINEKLGEQIVAIDQMKFQNGLVILDNFPKQQFNKLIKDTSIENFEIVEKNKAKIFDKLMDFKIKRNDKLLFPIDNYFNVKGIGTVVLGIVKNGEVNKFDKVSIEPLGKEVTIKGIQIQDKDFKLAKSGSRAGLNLKGVNADEIKRGFVLSNNAKKVSNLDNSIEKNKLYKNNLKNGEQIIVSSGLQCISAKLKTKKIELEKEMVLQKRIIIASTRKENLRIIGRLK